MSCSGRTSSAKSLEQIERLLPADPRNPGFRNLHAAVLGRAGDYDRALKIYADVVKEYPTNAKVWMSYGHALKTAGQQGDCVSTYRRAIELSPQLGEAYWSLANLKDIPLQRCRCRGHPGAVATQRSERGRSLALSLLARQGVRGRA